MAMAALWAGGCGQPGPTGATASGSHKAVRLAVGWSGHTNPPTAATEAMRQALNAYGREQTPRAAVFFAYFPPSDWTPSNPRQFNPDPAREAAAAREVQAIAGKMPTIGCRAQPLTADGTLLDGGVSVLLLGGAQAEVEPFSVDIENDRRKTGADLGQAAANVPDLKLLLTLAEPTLSFETDDGVQPGDFIDGLHTSLPEETVVFGGNSMLTPGAGLAGKQFVRGQPVNGKLVALAVGGPIEIRAVSTNEFKPVGQPMRVSDAQDSWVVKLNNKPAAEMYRRAVDLPVDQPLSRDWMHPLGVQVGRDTLLLRMIVNWVADDGKDAYGRETQLPPGALQFAAPIPTGSKVVAMTGGDSPTAIYDSARQAVRTVLADLRTEDTELGLLLLSDCCTRGMRLRTVSAADSDEVTQGVLSAMNQERIPLFGWYAFGELGPLDTTLDKPNLYHQQHVLLAAGVAVPNVPDPEPSTQPTTQPVDQDDTPATQPTSQPATTPPPDETESSSAPTTQPAEDPAENSAPTTQPTSQPAR